MERIIPIGFRFLPTPLELIVHYLLKKVKKVALPCDAIIENCNIYNDDEEEWWNRLKNSKEHNIYCFTNLNAMGKGNLRKERASRSKNFTWKESQKNAPIYYVSHDGRKFHVGSKKGFKCKAKSGVLKDIDGKILMDEYRLDGAFGKIPNENNIVVCHLKYQKNKAAENSPSSSAPISLPSMNWDSLGDQRNSTEDQQQLQFAQVENNVDIQDNRGIHNVEFLCSSIPPSVFPSPPVGNSSTLSGDHHQHSMENYYQQQEGNLLADFYSPSYWGNPEWTGRIGELLDEAVLNGVSEGA